MAGTYKSLFCSKMSAASVVVTCEVVGTLNHYKMVKKNFELCVLRGGGDIKSFQLLLALVLELALELVLELALKLELVLWVVGT